MNINEEVEEPDFDFSSPEDVLIYVEESEGNNLHGENWRGWHIEDYTVISGKEGVTGVASYEMSYGGGFLDYTIMGIIDCPKKAGYYVVAGMTGYYHKGDGWMTDDDMDFYFETVRPATEEEIKEFGWG